jgi:hypothetical protein
MFTGTGTNQLYNELTKPIAFMTHEYLKGLKSALIKSFKLDEEKVNLVFTDFDNTWKSGLFIPDGKQDKIRIVLDYSSTTHAIIGVSEQVKDLVLLPLNKEHNKKLFSQKDLTAGFGKGGWVVLDKEEGIALLKASFDKNQIPYETITKMEYEKKYLKDVKETKEVIKKEIKKKDKEEHLLKAKPKEKTSKKPKEKPLVERSLPQAETTKNKFGNMVDDEGIVYLNLPVGKDGKKKQIGIGMQIMEKGTKGEGLEVVRPFEDDERSDYKERNLLTDKLLENVKKNDSKLAKKLEFLLEEQSEESEEEEETDDEEEEENEDDKESDDE